MPSRHSQVAQTPSSALRLAPDAWVFPDEKVVWLSIAKNACTSIKWMFADLVGEDAQKLYRSNRAEVTRRMCIHDRGLWTKVRKPSDLDEKLRSEIDVANGWYIFTVIRDPRVRIWSAWQSKFLQRDPIYMRLYKDAPWLPRLPRVQQEVVDDFRTFVSWLASHPHDKLLDDPHFTSQAARLDRQTVPFTRIYDISELGAMVADLREHLHNTGVPGTPALGRDNDTSLQVTGELFDRGVREELESICSVDLTRFGGQWDFEPIVERRVSWTNDALEGIATRAAMGERIRDLVDTNWVRKRELKKTRDELGRLRSRVDDLEAQLAAERHRPSEEGLVVASKPAAESPRQRSSRNSVQRALRRAEEMGRRLRSQ